MTPTHIPTALSPHVWETKTIRIAAGAAGSVSDVNPEKQQGDDDSDKHEDTGGHIHDVLVIPRDAKRLTSFRCRKPQFQPLYLLDQQKHLLGKTAAFLLRHGERD